MLAFFRKILLSIAFTFLGLQFVSAAENPYSDIAPTDPYYNSVLELYNARVISDDGTHLFRPHDLMNRDFYVSLATAIGCKQCLTPTAEDIAKYTYSPFVDLPKTNEFYYCIAYAEDVGITQGYTLDPATHKTSCESGGEFSESPFCPDNKISRIEAAAMLLRRANLWDDTKNTSTLPVENFTDVSPYWYGYAVKGIEIGIITKKSDGSIGQDEKITRGEFAIMASKILQYTQCRFDSGNNAISSYIEIRGNNGQPTPATTFIEWENFSFFPKVENGNWSYSWTATPADGSSNTPKTGTDQSFSGNVLPPGKWIVSVKIIDPATGKVVSEPNVTVTILPKNPTNDDLDGDGVPNNSDQCPTVYGPRENNGCPLPKDGDADGDGVPDSTDACRNIPWPASNRGCPMLNTGIGVSISGTPNVTYIDNPVVFTPKISGNGTDLVYNWDFGDGNRSNTPGVQTHPYKAPGAYTITLTITDKTTGETAQSTMIVRITDNKDTDGDGIFDNDDQCPLIRGEAPSGCPNIKIPDYGCTIRGVYNGSIDCLQNFGNTDRDGDGVPDVIDRCPDVVGPASNNGCPLSDSVTWTTTNTDRDGDGTPDLSDRCPDVRGHAEWSGCPYPALYDNISQNVCLLNKLNNVGLITGAPSCNSCPCVNSVDITSLIRECDVVFPTILSPNKQTMYSRGNFYLVQ